MNTPSNIDVEFSPRPRVALFVDGNYLLAITRVLNIKLDVEAFFEVVTEDSQRLRTYWYSALESSLDRQNNAFRFLDRLRYIPRTKVYVGRMTKRSQGHYESALRTDAGISLSISMLELAQTGKIDAIYLVASDPEYTPAIRSVQQLGILVKLIHPTDLDERSLDVHPDLLKIVDERLRISSAQFLSLEYISDYREDTDKDGEYDLEDTSDIDDLDELEIDLDDVDEFDDTFDLEDESELDDLDFESDKSLSTQISEDSEG